MSLVLFMVSFTSVERIKGDHVVSLFTILFTSVLLEGSLVTTYYIYYTHEFMNELGDNHHSL
jgi:hypothetical protein